MKYAATASVTHNAPGKSPAARTAIVVQAATKYATTRARITAGERRRRAAGRDGSGFDIPKFAGEWKPWRTAVPARILSPWSQTTVPMFTSKRFALLAVAAVLACTSGKAA